MIRHYFDYAAATPVAPKVLHVMERFWSTEYGNPSAIHQEGILAKKAIDDARDCIADALGAPAKGIVFTSGATESIYLALVGVVRAWSNAHFGETPEIIVSAIEHDAVLETARQLEAGGVIVKRLPVDEFGIVTVSALRPLLTKNTVIVSCMLVNNEVGTLQPVNEIARIIRTWKKEVRGVSRDKSPSGEDMYPVLHTDVTQAVNYYALNIPRMGVDMLSCNASKIYGPKGVGMLYCHPLVQISPVVVGGGQERGLRAGTEPVPLIVGFSEAFVLAQDSAIQETLRLVQLRDDLFLGVEKLARELGVGMRVNGEIERRTPNNVHISFDGVDHEYLTVLLDDAGFSVSTKSACNMQEAETSHVLEAMALGGMINRPLSGLRITLGRETTRASCESLIAALREVLPLSMI